MAVDLHIHSTMSDGTDTPVRIVEKAARLGLKAIALTDHDTIDGLDSAEEAAKYYGIEFVRGCEFSANAPDGSPIHILGLWLPKNSSKLDALVASAKRARTVRNEQLLANLARLGFTITMKELQEVAGDSPGKPHIANLMVTKGYAESALEAFQVYLDRGGKAYVPRRNKSPEEIISALADLGAFSVFAHPLQDHSFEEAAAYAQKFTQYGLNAIEAYHSSHFENEIQACMLLASDLHLKITGGSDYHGDNKNVKMGYATFNTCPIPDEVYFLSF